jgi:hypothetical protein
MKPGQKGCLKGPGLRHEGSVFSKSYLKGMAFKERLNKTVVLFLSGLFRILLEIGNFGLHFLFTKIESNKETRSHNKKCHKSFENIFHINLPLQFLIKSKKKSIIYSKTSSDLGFPYFPGRRFAKFDFSFFSLYIFVLGIG